MVPKRRVADRQTDDQPKREDAVDQDLSVLRRAREFRVEMQRLRIQRQRGEQQIVGFGDGSRRLMRERVADRRVLRSTCLPSRVLAERDDRL